MMRNKVWPLLVVCVCLSSFSCNLMTDDEIDAAKTGSAGFQSNGPFDPNTLHPDFKLLEIFDGRGSLEEIWDSIDGPTFNDYLVDTVNMYPDAFVRASASLSGVLDDSGQPVAALLGTDLYNSIGTLMDTTRGFRTGPADIGAFYTQSAPDYTNGFYSMLDALWEGDQRPGDQELREMAARIFARSLDKKTLARIRDDIQDWIDDLQDDRFDDNFTLATEVLGKLTLQADYPLWIDAGGNTLTRENIDPAVHTNLVIGNAVQGANDLAAWVNRMLIDPTSRDYLYTAIRETGKIFDPAPASPNSLNLRTLLTNLENNFTVGGAVYESNPLYKSIATDPTYSDTELGQTLRELMPHIAQLLVRSDRPTSLVTTAPGDTPVYLLRETIDYLKNIGFNPDDRDLETSLYNMLRYDQWGRDRTDPASGAYDASHLDSLIFLTNISGNHGWNDGGATGESSDTTDPTFDHGHGYFGNVLTINDSLVSMTTNKTVGLGIYDIAMLPGDEDYLFRSNVAFDTADRDNYKFNFTPDYSVLSAMPGICAGSIGTPAGGNRDGVPPAQDTYAPFNPSGRGEKQLGAWTVGWAARACFLGEGPYYYEDPNAEIVSVGGKDYYKYLRPDGRVYALVNKDDAVWEYIYPTEDGDAEDPETAVTNYNGKRQRFNRFQSTWQSDYLMSRYNARSALGFIVSEEFRSIGKDANGDLTMVTLNAGDSAGRLTYDEIIPEDSPLHERACRSPEEAVFRNYQWVYTEKKMVVILPQHLFLTNLGIRSEGTAFLIFECHGYSGLANLRKIAANHVWAKKGTNGASDIPGDYRVELVAEVTGPANILLTESSIYNNTLGTGHGTPSIVGRSLPSLYRLAFPLSPRMDRGNGVQDYELGSGEFTVGDAVWRQRNAFMPPFVALLGAILRHTPTYTDGYDRDSLNCGIRGFINGLAMLQKPQVYYEKNGAGTVPPYDCWKMRVHGTQRYNDWTGDYFLQPAVGFPGALTWNGSDAERLHYQPATLKNLLNVLTDSDITAPVTDGKRMDGLLPMVLQTQTLSSLVKTLMSDTNDSDQFYSALEQILGAVKYTQGTMTAINAAPTATKKIPYPAWMFATGTGSGDFGEYTGFTNVREEDIILDKILDHLVGHDSLPNWDGYGLADYVDTQEAEGWVEFDNDMNALEDYLYPSGPYNLVDPFIRFSDAVFAREAPYTDGQIAGLIYGLGKLCTYYDTPQNRWIIQGEAGFDDIYKIFNSRIPAMHALIRDDSGANYGALITIGEDMLRDDGMAEYLLDAMSTDDGAEGFLGDLRTFLGDDPVRDPAPLWSTLSQLMADLSRSVDQSKGGAAVKAVYDKYGFQIND